MPNNREHREVNTAVCGLAGAIINIFRQINRIDRGEQDKFNLWELGLDTIGAAGIDYLTAGVPDGLEPSDDNPNHRGPCHSVALGTLLGIVALKSYDTTLPEKAKDALAIGALSYNLHLLSDAQTPKGLPLTGIKLK